MILMFLIGSRMSSPAHADHRMDRPTLTVPTITTVNQFLESNAFSAGPPGGSKKGRRSGVGMNTFQRSPHRGKHSPAFLKWVEGTEMGAEPDHATMLATLSKTFASTRGEVQWKEPTLEPVLADMDTVIDADKTAKIEARIAAEDRAMRKRLLAGPPFRPDQQWNESRHADGLGLWRSPDPTPTGKVHTTFRDRFRYAFGQEPWRPSVRQPSQKTTCSHLLLSHATHPLCIGRVPKSSRQDSDPQ